jgi:hypothetical protein
VKSTAHVTRSAFVVEPLRHGECIRGYGEDAAKFNLGARRVKFTDSLEERFDDQNRGDRTFIH